MRFDSGVYYKKKVPKDLMNRLVRLSREKEAMNMGLLKRRNRSEEEELAMLKREAEVARSKRKVAEQKSKYRSMIKSDKDVVRREKYRKLVSAKEKIQSGAKKVGERGARFSKNFESISGTGFGGGRSRRDPFSDYDFGFGSPAKTARRKKRKKKQEYIIIRR